MESAPQKFSCFACRQRKIRCDRVQPCTHCIKATRQCEYIAPVRGKRRKLKPPKESLHAKLARYESLLKSYGAKIDQKDADSSGESDTDVDMAIRSPSAETPSTLVDNKSPTDPFGMLTGTLKPKFIAKNGSSRYFEK
jgi:hypothetical protein